VKSENNKGVMDGAETGKLYKAPADQPSTRNGISSIISSLNITFLPSTKKVKSDDLTAIQSCAISYLSYCEQHGNIPTVQGFSGWLGISRKTFYDWLRDTKKPATRDLLERIRDMFVEISTQAAMRNKINPVTWIFYAKNYFEMRDSVDINTYASADPLEPQKSAEELKRQYEANDVDD
jgi:hypothetical protein